MSDRSHPEMISIMRAKTCIPSVVRKGAGVKGAGGHFVGNKYGGRYQRNFAMLLSPTKWTRSSVKDLIICLKVPA